MWKCSTCKEDNPNDNKFCIHCFTLKNEQIDNLQLCSNCSNKQMTLQSGMQCSITNQKPKFDLNCALYEMSEKFKIKKDSYERRMKNEGTYDFIGSPENERNEIVGYIQYILYLLFFFIIYCILRFIFF